jgi:hypothetical protein
MLQLNKFLADPRREIWSDVVHNLAKKEKEESKALK